MKQGTIPMKVSKRKARDERLQQFDALAAFANVRDTPDDWRKFRAKWPSFFPDYLTAWLYKTAEDWKRLTSLGDVPPQDLHELRRKWPELFPVDSKDWVECAKSLKASLATMRPPLLFYRDLLRAVWKRQDQDGSCLKALLGFEREAAEETLRIAVFSSEPHPKPPPGQSTWRRFEGGIEIKDQATYGGLPSGKPVVDGVSATIAWEFGCQFQRAIYDLIQDRWRAMVCPTCAKYFIADKTAQKYCSTECYARQKAIKSLNYYDHKGKFKRQEAKLTRAKARRRKQG